MNRGDSYPSLNNFNGTYHSSSNDHDDTNLNENSNTLRASTSDLNLHHMAFPQMANANSHPSELIAGLGADFAFLWETNRAPAPNISPNGNVDVNNLLPDRIVLRAASTDLLTLVQAYDWPATLQRIAMIPSEASTIGIQGRTPLHVACDQDAPALVIKALLAADKSAATKVGTSNMTPLHITCSSQHASVEVVQVLLDGVDECDIVRFTGMKDVDGDTALHASCRCNSPIEVLEVLLKANPSTVNERDFEGLTPLLRLWVRYFVMLKIDLDAVTGIEAIDGELGEGWWEKTLLLLRAAYQGNVDSQDNDQIEVKGIDAVHRECEGKNRARQKNEQSGGGEVYSTSSYSTDVGNHTPKQSSVSVCNRCRSCDRDESQKSKESVQKQFYPLHAAAAIDCPRPVVKIATKQYPEQTSLYDTCKRTPLMIAAMVPIYKEHDLTDEGYAIEDQIHGDDAYEDSIYATGSSEQQKKQPSVIQILLEANADASQKHGDNERLPLHLAILSGKKWDEGVQAIRNAYPDAGSMTEPVTGLYPFMLAAIVGAGEFKDYLTSGKDADLYTIFELFRSEPISCSFGKSKRGVVEKKKTKSDDESSKIKLDTQK